jgi:AcrR family transcriptional regulator
VDALERQDDAVTSTGSRPIDAQQPAADDREHLIRAARVVLARTGWRGFKVNNVVREAHVSTRSFYEHFATKDDLLMALLLSGSGYLARSLWAIARADRPAEVRLALSVDRLLEVATDAHAPFVALLSRNVHELRSLFPDAATRCDEMLAEPLVHILRDLAQEAAAGVAVPENDARTIYRLIASFNAALLSGDLAVTHERARELTIPFIWRALSLTDPPV